MRELVKAIVGDSILKAVTLDAEPASAAPRPEDLFERLTSGKEHRTKAEQQVSPLSRILRSYDKRLVGGCRFSLIGKGHSRRYQAERITNL